MPGQPEYGGVKGKLPKKAGLSSRLHCAVDGKLVITKPEASFREARGMLPANPSLTQELLTERAKDREREEAKIRAG